MPLRCSFIYFFIVFLSIVTDARAADSSDAARWGQWGGADNEDSLSHALREVVVSGGRPSIIPDVVPAQKLSGDELLRLNSQSVADAMRYFAGAQIKDYGGVGGVKTINVRSMGAAHTTVVYDGIALGNAQNGQIDLGQLSLDNVESLSLYRSGKADLLLSAREMGAAAAVHVRTRVPHFGTENMHLRAMVRGGSFGLINPSLLFEGKISPDVSASVNAEWTHATGHYRFAVRKYSNDGTKAYDTTAVRQGGDIDALRLETNVFGNHRHGTWAAKVYGYGSDRGIPGAIVNNVWKRGERQSDVNVFAQGRYTSYYRRFSTTALVKAAYYGTHYVNDDDRQLNVDNRYHQQEIYASTANQYEIFPWWRTSLSYDFMLNTMYSDQPHFERPWRLCNYLSAATALEYRRLKVRASVLGTFIRDMATARVGGTWLCKASPSIAASLGVIDREALVARASFKQSLRMPTFNDLYYTADMSNANLRPEQVRQYCLGLVSTIRPMGLVRNAELSLDGYYNNVTDKIIAYPRGNQFRWTVVNLGRVHIAGFDAAGSVSLAFPHDVELTLRGQYTYQLATDYTNTTDIFYGCQIPYTPHSSGSAVVNATWRRWQLNASWVAVGPRYSGQENNAANYMPMWNTVDLSAGRDISISRYNLRLMAEVNNLLDTQYQVVRNYPMPGINGRLIVLFWF